MSPWIGNIIFVVGFVASIVIRIPYDKVSQKTPINESRKDVLEKIVLSFMVVGMLILPGLSFAGLLSFASYRATPAALAVGTLLMAASLWVFHRSHADLGRNWSVSLEIREGHSLVTRGVYRYVRHPMYTSIYLMAVGQAFLISNWLAGPATIMTFTLMFLSRLGREERMMLDRFGPAYEAYRRTTKRLVPWVW
jgi:protein-S-isoprenylcysteine O-methyltransferase Ste14